MANTNVQKLGDILRTLDHVMLTTRDQGGFLVSRPMALRVDEFDGVLLLVAPLDSRVITNITADPKVNISHTGPLTSLSVAGTAIFSPSRERVNTYWHSGLTPWFPRGADRTALIEITVEEARFWTFAGQQRSPQWFRDGIRQIDVADLV